MTHWSERLSEYLDDELTPPERAACEAHLAECEACRLASEEMRMVVAFARADVDQAPTGDLWPGILSRISELKGTPSGLSVATAGVFAGASAKAEAVAFKPGRGARKQIAFTLPQLALAASLLIAVSASVAYLAAGRAARVPVAQEDPVQAQAEFLVPLSASVERANFADAQFDQAVTDLEKVLTDRREQLDPRTVFIIERNLAAIDEAIREARAALDADPANTFLNSHLADARRKKLELLRRATMISGD
jgi:anti-sigma factor RsiW